ncbi:VCBS repeat-containing protein [Neobacillus mesonae]|nr:VCBS repeat-containing protein [Neobacillus mesonae]
MLRPDSRDLQPRPGIVRAALPYAFHSPFFTAHCAPSPAPLSYQRSSFHPYSWRSYDGLRAPFQHESAPIRADFTGDGIEDTAMLAWNSSAEGSPYVTDITLIIQNGAGGPAFQFQLPESSGYSPTLFAGDFSGDGIPDLFISIQSGGSGAFTYNYLYSYNGGVLRELFSSDRYNNEQIYQVDYLDYYRLQVTSVNHLKTYLLDISSRGSEYLSAIYNEDGTLKHPLQGDVLPVSGVYPVDFDQDGIYELLAFQGIMGQYNADRFGYVQNALKYQNGSWSLMNQWVAIYGSDVPAGS